MSNVLDAEVPAKLSDREQFLAQLAMIGPLEKEAMLQRCSDIRGKLAYLTVALLGGNKDTGIAHTLLELLDRILDEPTNAETTPAQIPLEVTLGAIQRDLPPEFWNFAKDSIQAAVENALASGEEKITTPSSKKFKPQGLGVLPKDRVQYVRETKEFEVKMIFIPLDGEEAKDDKDSRTLKIVVTRLPLEK